MLVAVKLNTWTFEPVVADDRLSSWPLRRRVAQDPLLIKLATYVFIVAFFECLVKYEVKK
jgi:hypothetical protein